MSLLSLFYYDPDNPHIQVYNKIMTSITQTMTANAGTLSEAQCRKEDNNLRAFGDAQEYDWQAAGNALTHGIRFTVAAPSTAIGGDHKAISFRSNQILGDDGNFIAWSARSRCSFPTSTNININSK